MLALLLCFAMAHLPAPAAAGSLRLGLDSWLEGPDRHGFRCEASGAGSRLILAYQGGGPPGGAPPGSFAFGLSTPWISAGTLAPAGLIRETANPLGFGPESDVFREDTGFTLDGSVASPQRAAVLLMPVPGCLGLFCREGSGGGRQMGGFVRVSPANGFALEGFAALASPAADARQEQWYVRLPPFPGALLVQSSARLLLDLPRAAASFSLGISGGERCPPGTFLHARVRMGEDAASASLFLGVVDGSYTTLSGDGSLELLKASGTFAVRRPFGAAELSCSVGVGQPPFAPAGYLATAGSAAASIERVYARGAAGSVTTRLEAQRSIRMEPDGSRKDSVDCTSSLIVRLRRLEVEAGASTDGAGARARASARWMPAGSAPLASLDVSLECQDPVALLSAEAHLRIERRDGTISLGAGIEELPLARAGPIGAGQTEAGRPGNVLVQALRFHVGWETR
jgi:hypothetical protein